jgi:hypothetical protein
MQNKTESLPEINRLLDMYIREIESSELKPLAANIYLTHAKNFVRWINGEFVPGGRLEKNKIRS